MSYRRHVSSNHDSYNITWPRLNKKSDRQHHLTILFRYAVPVVMICIVLSYKDASPNVRVPIG